MAVLASEGTRSEYFEVMENLFGLSRTLPMYIRDCNNLLVEEFSPIEKDIVIYIVVDRIHHLCIAWVDDTPMRILCASEKSALSIATFRDV